MNKTGRMHGAAAAFIMAAMLVFPSGKMTAQKVSVSDSTVTAMRVKNLESRRAELKAKIKEEDAKRGRVLEGLTPEANERLNTAQDSVCLELRSQLVSVELELGEMAPDASQDALLRQLDALRKRVGETDGGKGK